MAQIWRQRLSVGEQHQCGGCGATRIVTSIEMARAFAVEHSRCGEPLPVAPGYYGLGDLVAAVAKPIARIFGQKEQCTPCAQRQAAMNQAAPRMWRRR